MFIFMKLEYSPKLKKKSKKRSWIRRGTLAAGLLVTYPLTLLGIEYLASRWLSPKITSQPELQRVIDERKERLGIEERIEGVLLQETIGVSGASINTGMKKIYVGGDLATRIVVDHELYHEHKGDMDISKNFTTIQIIKNTYIEEPCARIYSLLGIKL